MSRFQQIYNYIEDTKPGVLLEVGTWNGVSARKMLKLGAKKYIGFDIWEDGSDELDKIENNVKKRVTKESVEEVLKGFDVELIQGNTRLTFTQWAKDKKPFVDVVIIDGGHSVATIKSDFLNAIKVAKTDGVIFIDDYYFGCPDFKVGANIVMGQVNCPYTVLPKVDKAKDGYVVKICRIDMKDVPRIDWEMPESKSWRYEP